MNTSLYQGQTGIVSVDLQALGNENALGFSLSFDPSALVYVGARLGSNATGSTLNVNALQAASGRLGFVLALATGGNFAAGTQEVVEVSFRSVNGALGAYPVMMTDSPVRRQVSDPAASSLATTYFNGTVMVNPRPSLALQRSGPSVTLVWPLWATNFVLEKADSLSPPAGWTNWGTAPTQTNSQNQVTVPFSGASGFFRLRAQ